MAPKNKFTRDEMVQAALGIARTRGIDAVTARAIAEELGVSTQPIFTCFNTMDEAKNEVRAAAEKIYQEYAASGLSDKTPFFGFGMQYIRFAKEEPRLYRLLFLTPTDDKNSGAIEAMKRSQAVVREPLMNIYRITADEADRYFRDMWLVVHSIATLIVTGSCPYSEREIGAILTGFSVSICKSIKEIPGFAAGEFDRDSVFKEIIAE